MHAQAVLALVSWFDTLKKAMVMLMNSKSEKRTIVHVFDFT